MFQKLFNKEISLAKFVLLASFINVILYQVPLFKYSINHLDIHTGSGFLTFLSVVVMIISITTFLFYLIALISKTILKIFLAISFIINSIAIYFVLTYNVVLDRSMIGNIFDTRYSEASAYFDPTIFLYILFLGILPSYILYKLKIKPTKRLWLFIEGIYGHLSLLSLYCGQIF